VGLRLSASIRPNLKNDPEQATDDNNVFGFVRAGVKASIPLPIADRYGKWTLNAGVSAMLLGANTSEYNGGDDDQLIGTIGLQLNF